MGIKDDKLVILLLFDIINYLKECVELYDFIKKLR